MALAPLSGVRLGMIDVLQNEAGLDLPFPGDFALEAHFVHETSVGVSRFSFVVESPGFMPSLLGSAAEGAEFTPEGGSGEAHGTGRFMGVTTDFTLAFSVSSRAFTAELTVGASGNLPGGKALVFVISCGEALN